VDAVAGLLDGPRARGAFLLRSSMDPPWSLRIEDEAPLTLVAVVRGHAWIAPDGGEPARLDGGHVAIVRGPGHYLVADDPGTPAQAVIHPGQRCTTPDGRELERMTELGVRTWGNARDGAAVLLTGTYQLDGEVSTRLLRALPALLVLRDGEWDCPLVGLLADEIVKDEAAQEAVLDRLLDLLLIAVLRGVRPPRGARARLVSHVRRPGGWPRAAAAAPQPRAFLDGGGAGARDRRIARGARAPLQRARRRAADGVPHRLPHRARGRPPARARRNGRLGRTAGRLREPVRPQHRLQAAARGEPAPAPRGRDGPAATVGEEPSARLIARRSRTAPRRWRRS